MYIVNIVNYLLSIVLTSILLTGCVQKTQTAAVPSSVEEQMHVEAESEKAQYVSPTPKEECTICSRAKGTLLPAYWGEDNVGVIDLNQFQFAHIEINPYEEWGRYSKEDYGRSSTSMLNTGEGGLSILGSVDPNRGYYTGEVSIKPSNVLKVDQMSRFLCTDCVNTILPQSYDGESLNIGIINFKTKEIRLLEKNVSMFFMGDFYIGCDFREREWEDKQEQWFDLLIFYCPPRYTM